MTEIGIGAGDAAAGRQRTVAHLAMLLFAALIAGSFTFGAMTVPYIKAAPLNALRFVLAALFMGVFAFGIARQRLAWPAAPWRFAVNGFLTAIYFVTMFIALTMTQPVATSAVYTLVPLMTAVTAWFIVGQRSGPAVLVSLLLAGAGAIWVIFRGDLEALLSFDIGQGEIIYFVGCIAYAIYTPLLRRFNRGEPAMVLSFWTMAACAAWITAWGLPEILATDWLSLPPVVWGVVLYLAIGPTAICFFLIQFASAHLPAAKVIAYGYIVPAFVIVFEGIVGHGWASLSVAAGALVTVLGLVVLAALRDA
ncbi:DMT family transporter [Devosia sp. ZB163]|uniref:DMT family transporter n=1 Tax=Devosia sp. ZB163 TaxID=3025938 RepID=UPI0023621F75|nr:DMT family transporter [Devosia sp. ZB163]MDC9823135.1 DMT family transporter [Devosia sp. ZB163]